MASDRFQRTAQRIAAHYGVSVEWAPANRQYVVEQRPCATAREAWRHARNMARMYAAQCGAGDTYP